MKLNKFAPIIKIYQDNESGQAIVIVLGVMLTLLLFGLALITISVNRVSATYQDLQYQDAVAAASYGSAFAIAALNDEANLPFICYQIGFCNNTLQVPGTNETFVLTLSPSNWQNTCQQNLLADKNCTVTFNSTGYYKNAHATVSFTISRSANQYLQYTYYTNYETADPADSEVYCNYGCPLTTSQAQKLCPYHYYDYNPYTQSNGPDYNDGCVQIEFASQDTINGPLFTNDDPTICGATFLGPVYTGDPNPGDAPFYTCYGGNFYGGGIYEIGFIPPPPNTNAVGTAALAGGCTYYGPTLITLKPNDVVNVISPDTKQLPSNPFTQAGGCGVPGNSSGGCLNTSSGCTLNWASSNCGLSACFDGAVQINSSPTKPSDPNYWIISSGKSTAPTCSSGKVDGYYWAINSEVVVPNTAPNGQNCLNGDLLIQGDPNSYQYAMVNSGQGPSPTKVPGAFDLRASMAAQQNVIIVGNLVYNHGPSYNYLSNPYDALGLIAQNFIELNNPNCIYCNVFTTPQTATQTENPVIDSTLLAAAHSWTPINWSVDTPYEDGQGYLNITGSIIQDFRGIVGYVGQTGWNKNYVYDQNLLTNPPPWFPQPPWQILNYTEP